jgi:DNA-binding winged helix-turn-helix (wHTH) protein
MKQEGNWKREEWAPDFEIDHQLFEVRRDGLQVRLEPKVFDVLAYLLEHRHRLVGKDELMRELWRDARVEPTSLTRCIYRIRKALGARACIETRYRRGYRLVLGPPLAPSENR